MKTIALLFYLLIVLSETGKAQQKMLDSLRQELSHHTKPNDKKLRIFNQLADTYMWMQVDSGITYANYAIELAIKLNNQKELAEAFNNKAKNMASTLCDSSIENIVKQSHAINTKIKNNNGLADNYIMFGSLKINVGEREKGIAFLEKAKLLYSQTKNKNGLAFVNFWHAWALLTNMDSNCVTLFLKANQLFTETNYTPGLCASLDGMGCFYSQKGNYTDALNYLNKAASINRQNNIISGLTQDYANISSLYLYTSNYPKALNFMLKALRLSEQSGASIQEAFCINAVASLYLKLGDYPKALTYSAKGIALLEQVNQVSALPYAYNTTGGIYSKLNKLDSAYKHFKKAMELALQLKDSSAQAECHFEIGLAQFKEKDYGKAIENFKKSFSLSKKLYGKSEAVKDLLNLGKCIGLASDEILKNAGINPATKNELIVRYFEQAKNETSDISIRRDAYFELSKFYEQHADLKKSFANYKLYILHRDSIMNTENSNALNNTQAQYETEKKEQQIALLTKDKKLQAAKIQKNKTTTLAFVGGISLIALMIGIMYRGYRVKLHANKKIENTLTHLQTTQTQLVQQGKLSSLGKMTADVALEIQHPLHELNIHSSESGMLIDNYLNAADEDIKNTILSNLQLALKEINEQGKIADGIVKNILIQHRK